MKLPQSIREQTKVKKKAKLLGLCSHEGGERRNRKELKKDKRKIASQRLAWR